MAEFILSGFADEASESLDDQIVALKALGITHIEPRNVDGKNVSKLTAEEAESVRAKLDAAGIAVSSIGSPIGKIDINDDMDEHIALLKNTISVAQILGAKYIRMFSFFVPAGHEDEYEAEVFARMERMLETARGTGVQLVHENEKAIYGDSVDRCVKLMERFAPELGFVFDPSNFVQCEQDTRYGFEKLSRYITYMHMKDSKYPDNAEKEHRDMGFEGVSDAHRPVGQGDGNVSYIIDQLIASDYKGYMSIEPHLTNCALVPGTPTDKFNAAARALIGLIESKGQSWN
jgi:sugar phosphate isomerase/epimerase